MTSEDRKAERKKAERIIAENRKASHDYHLLEIFEAGMVVPEFK